MKWVWLKSMSVCMYFLHVQLLHVHNCLNIWVEVFIPPTAVDNSDQGFTKDFFIWEGNIYKGICMNIATPMFLTM